MKIFLSKTQPLVLSLAVVLVIPLHAQSSTTLNEVVVTANRVEQPITEVVADVSIIEREQIERLGVT